MESRLNRLPLLVWTASAILIAGVPSLAQSQVSAERPRRGRQPVVEPFADTIILCVTQATVQIHQEQACDKRLSFVVATAATIGASAYGLLGGRRQYVPPADWREVRKVDNDSVSFVAFVVPRPNRDSLAPAGNVMVDAAVSHRRWNLKTYSDAKLRHEAAGPGRPVIVDDRAGDEDRSRTVLSTSQLRGTAYALWDKFAVRDSIYLDIRTAIPVAYASDSAWHAHYEAEL
jgi:hypothetical protein